MCSALLTTISVGFSSTLRTVIVPSSTIMEKRVVRSPSPKPRASRVSPVARANSPLPSASMSMAPPAPVFSPQAFITKASLTDTQAIWSTPLALSASACARKLGTCLAEQVGVNAPGTAKRAVFLPPK